jgi:hypothetical protein
MQVNSIDTQVLIPRTMDAGRAQNIRDQHPMVQQDLGSMLIKGKDKAASKQVQNTEQTEKKRVRDEKKEQSRRQKEKNKQKAKAKGEEDDEIVYMAVDSVRGHNIDIST